MALTPSGLSVHVALGAAGRVAAERGCSAHLESRCDVCPLLSARPIWRTLDPSSPVASVRCLVTRADSRALLRSVAPAGSAIRLAVAARVHYDPAIRKAPARYSNFSSRAARWWLVPLDECDGFASGHLDGARGLDASDLAAEREWAAPGCGRRGRGDGGRVEQGDEAEESPSHKGAMRARGEAPVDMQGVQRLSAREAALSVQGVRWELDLRARSSAP